MENTTDSEHDSENLPVQNTSKLTERESERIQKWQNKIVLWLIGMPTLLILLFVYMASKQVDNFNKALEVKSDTTLNSIILPLLKQNNGQESNEKLIKWVVLTKLEQESINRRYNQGGLLLMSRIFVKYLGFFTGMILTILGAVFIVGKLSENTTNMEGSISETAKFKLISSSPGIIFGVLGTILMLSTILKHNDIEVQDSPLYLNSTSILSIGADDLISKKSKKKTIDFDTSELDSITNNIPEKQ
ncbi:MAG: hypothetical protein V4683_16670 [Bacteroidota bacterium]